MSTLPDYWVEEFTDDERARLIRERAELRDRISHAESIGA